MSSCDPYFQLSTAAISLHHFPPALSLDAEAAVAAGVPLVLLLIRINVAQPSNISARRITSAGPTHSRRLHRQAASPHSSANPPPPCDRNVLFSVQLFFLLFFIFNAIFIPVNISPLTRRPLEVGLQRKQSCSTEASTQGSIQLHHTPCRSPEGLGERWRLLGAPVQVAGPAGAKRRPKWRQ